MDMIDLSENPLVETDWLAGHLHDSNLRVVDMRWRADGSGREVYQAGHIPGATYLDWQRDLNWTDERGVRDLLLPPVRFAAVMEAAGIGSDSLVVAYAETDHSGAARLWWALRYYGHDQVAVLNGGWTKWVAEDREIGTDLPQPRPAVFIPRPRPHWLATADEIEYALNEASPDVRLVDTRPPEQYSGKAIWTPQGSLFLPPGQDWIEVSDGRVMRAGHIPGAMNIHASTNLNPFDWTYLPVEELRDKMERAGIEAGQRIITYCGVGISASLGLFALYLAGSRNIALYDASWEDWGTDPTKLVVGEAGVFPDESLPG
jgi:thiosulfate/3-mercaptopyruvate sulfurtransferase